jgi:hypothetical protein
VGSVYNAAERNAIVDFKPTVNLTSLAGDIPARDHQDSVGTLAKTVRDAVCALDAIYGVDGRGCCKAAAFVLFSGYSFHDSILQIPERQFVQVCTVLGTELKSVAVDIDQLDTRSLSPLLRKPLLVEADCYRQSFVAFTIGIHITHLEGTESDLLPLHSRY